MLNLSAEQTTEISDTELVRQCQSGDRHSFRMLYQRYQHRVRSTLFQLCGKTVLDDLVQEVFLKAWQGLPKLRNPEYFATWIYRISWNVATDQRRRFARQSTVPVDIETQDYLMADQEEETLTALHYQELIQQGLQTLSLDHRAVLVLHDLKDLPQKEVAEVLDVPLGTVKSRLHHARRSLRQFLETQGVKL